MEPTKILPTLDEEMKQLEQVYAGVRLDKSLPVLVRLDGKGFSKFTKSLKGKNKPFDERLTFCMQETTRFLLEQTHAKLGYTQSDEITLVYFKQNDNEDDYYGGKVQKLSSILASFATARFNQLITEHVPEKKNNLAIFDARVWNVPDLSVAARVLLWRENDAMKNSVSMAASSSFSHKELMGKSSGEKIDMLQKIGIDFNEYPENFRRGSYFKRHYELAEIAEQYQQFLKPGEPTSTVSGSVKQFCPPVLRTKSVAENVDTLFKIDPLLAERKSTVRNGM